jgi:predicted transport protein
MALGDEVKKLLGTADKLKGPAGNEANTKALLIEPMLAALGWRIADLDQVVREWRVYDNTSLDYALMVGKKPGLYLEAKAISKKLDDKQFIAQAVNYANNDGVLWCVLTNGLTWRVYKTNEPVAMEQKLLFEVDLADIAAGSAADAAKSLQLLSRESLMDGSLDLWGERVFTDTRVRKALAELAGDPPSAFLEAIVRAMGKPETAIDRLKESIARVFDSQIGAAPGKNAVLTPSASKPPVAPRTAGGKKEYPLSHHLDGKPTAMVDLFERLDEYGRSLGANVTRRVRKQYIGYFRGKKSFFTLEIQRQRVIVYLSLDPAAIQELWVPTLMRNVTEIGHFGMGNTEYSLRDGERVGEVRNLMELAYHRT